MAIRLAGSRNTECHRLIPPNRIYVACEELDPIIGLHHSVFHGRTLDCMSARVGQLLHRIIRLLHFDDGLIFVASFTGGSILMLGP